MPPVPSLPNIAVCGTGNSETAGCHARVVTDRKGLVRTNLIPVGYGPAQFLGGYSLTGFASGNPIIAVVDAYGDPYIEQDLKTYSQTFGIPVLPSCSGPISSSSVPCFQKVDQNGGSRYPLTNSGWALETALDVEVAHAVCQNCKILLVQAKSNRYSDLMTAVDRARLMGASVISNSYGSGEFSTETSYDSHFNFPGIAFTFSSGDSGYGPEYPAASRYVTAVGGTTLYLNADNSYNHEVAWSGAGSGCSSFEGKPAWQTDSQCTKRTIADVSADADPSTGAAVYSSVRYGGVRGWFQVGGTSLASPIVAATYALSGNTSGSANSLPYSLLNYTINLNDVSAGANGSCGGTYLCTSTSGFDGPTGLGSPKGPGAF